MIIRSLISPSAYFGPEGQLHSLATNDGRVHSGKLLSTDSDSTTLLLADGAKLVIPAADIEILQSQRKSIMPDGLEATVSVEGLRDLVAFLGTLK